MDPNLQEILKIYPTKHLYKSDNAKHVPSTSLKHGLCSPIVAVTRVGCHALSTSLLAHQPTGLDDGCTAGGAAWVFRALRACLSRCLSGWWSWKLCLWELEEDARSCRESRYALFTGFLGQSQGFPTAVYSWTFSDYNLQPAAALGHGLYSPMTQQSHTIQPTVSTMSPPELPVSVPARSLSCPLK